MALNDILGLQAVINCYLMPLFKLDMALVLFGEGLLVD